MNWVKSKRSIGGEQLNLEDCEGWVYFKRGYWVGEYIELPNHNGSIAEIFESEENAKKWCEHKCKIQEIVWREQ